MFLLLASGDAFAKKEKPPEPFECGWRGEAKDPFTGEDARTTGRAWLNGLSLRFNHVAADVVPAHVVVRQAGVIEPPMEKPLMILLVDGTVVSVPLPAAVTGIASATQSGVFTTFTLTYPVPKADAEKIASSTGVSRIRLELPGGDWTMTFNEEDVAQVPGFMTCALSSEAPAP